MIRYFDGMGNDRTTYVQGLEAKIQLLENLEKENAILRNSKPKVKKT